MNQKPKTYNQLRKEWYKKLKDSGFNDIERRDGEFKDSRGIPTQLRVTKVFWEAKETYYYLAQHFLTEYKFESELEKTIWEYHLNGISYRNISKILEKVNIRADRQKIFKIVKKLKEIMLKKYLAKN